MPNAETLLQSLFASIRSSDNVAAQSATTDRAALSAFYDVVPGPLPKLFEQLLLSYRWLHVEIPEVTLFGNPPGADLSGFQQEIMSDRHLYPVLFSHKLVEFGKAPGGSYDPICFDLNRSRGRDCPIVCVNHESVLMYSKVKITSERALSFRTFAEGIVKAG
jgi:hypothetical protein